MKFTSIFILFLVASINGLRVEDGLEVETDEDAKQGMTSSLKAICINQIKLLGKIIGIFRPGIDTCEGNCELLTLQSRRPQRLFKVEQSPTDNYVGWNSMKITKDIPQSGRKILKVKGNCCWKFYQRFEI